MFQRFVSWPESRRARTNLAFDRAVEDLGGDAFHSCHYGFIYASSQRERFLEDAPFNPVWFFVGQEPVAWTREMTLSRVVILVLARLEFEVAGEFNPVWLFISQESVA